LDGIHPGALIDGRYEVVSELGEGGMGVVYQARQPSMNRNVAIKFLKPTLLENREQVDRFIREAQLVSKLSHANIVNVYSVGTTPGGQPYIAMELLEGNRLSDLIAARGFLPVAEALPLFIQVCNALSHAHEKQIVHRDIKPSNIMITHHDNGEMVVKVVDFGIAKSISDGMPALTQTGLLMGSAFYMSPGQCAGRTSDMRSDVYSLGCTLFETLTGKPPFIGESFYETLNKQLCETPPAVNDVNRQAGISGELQAVLDCMLEKEPANRYQSMELLKSDLERILNGEKPCAIPSTQAVTSSYLNKKSSPRRGVQALAIVAAVAACACLAWPVLDSMTRPRLAPNASESAHELFGKAVIADQAERFDEALHYFQKCLDGSRPLDNKHFLSVIYHRMGWVYFKKWFKDRDPNKSNERLDLAQSLLSKAIGTLEPSVLANLKDANSHRKAEFRDDVTLLLTCYWDLYRVADQLKDSVQQFQQVDKINAILARNLSYVSDSNSYLIVNQWAINKSIEEGDEAKAKRYIQSYVSIMTRAHADPTELSDDGEKFTQAMTSRFSPEAGKWCAQQFSAKAHSPSR
jgi:serine/threonine protein kinase